MVFLDAVREVGFLALVLYVAIVVLAHLFHWRRFDPMRWLGCVCGVVVGVGLAAQLGLGEIARAIVCAGSMVVVGRLFQSLGSRFPLEQTRSRSPA